MESLQDIIRQARELAKKRQPTQFLCIFESGRWLIVDDPELWEVKSAERVIEVPSETADYLWKKWRDRQDFDFLAIVEDVLKLKE